MKKYLIEEKNLDIIKGKGYIRKEVCHYNGEKYGYSINFTILTILR